MFLRIMFNVCVSCFRMIRSLLHSSLSFPYPIPPCCYGRYHHLRSSPTCLSSHHSSGRPVAHRLASVIAVRVDCPWFNSRLGHPALSLYVASVDRAACHPVIYPAPPPLTHTLSHHSTGCLTPSATSLSADHVTMCTTSLFVHTPVSIFF